MFVADWTDPASVKQLRDAGLTVYQFRSPVTVSGIEESITRIGTAVGEEDAAQGVVREMERRLSAVAEKLSRLPPGRKLSVMDYNTWGTSMGAGSSWDEIVRRAGLRNAVDGLRADAHGAVPIAREKILQLDPDILLVPAWVYGNRNRLRLLLQGDRVGSCIARPAGGEAGQGVQDAGEHQELDLPVHRARGGDTCALFVSRIIPVAE